MYLHAFVVPKGQDPFQTSYGSYKFTPITTYSLPQSEFFSLVTDTAKVGIIQDKHTYTQFTYTSITTYSHPQSEFFSLMTDTAKVGIIQDKHTYTQYTYTPITTYSLPQ